MVFSPCAHPACGLSFPPPASLSPPKSGVRLAGALNKAAQGAEVDTQVARSHLNLVCRTHSRLPAGVGVMEADEGEEAEETRASNGREPSSCSVEEVEGRPGTQAQEELAAARPGKRIQHSTMSIQPMAMEARSRQAELQCGVAATARCTLAKLDRVRLEEMEEAKQIIPLRVAGSIVAEEA